MLPSTIQKSRRWDRQTLTGCIGALVLLLMCGCYSSTLTRDPGIVVWTDSHIAPSDAGLSWNSFAVFDEAPVLLHMPAPAYPLAARQTETEGTVRANMLVGCDGSVHKIAVNDCDPAFVQPVIDAAKEADFKPALKDKRPVSVWVQIPLRFSLH